MKELILSLLKLISNPVILIPLIAAIALFAVKAIITLIIYYHGSYHKVTHLPYYSVVNDTGKYGEYLTYKYLHRYERQGAKLLFNVYLPKGENETSEIDLLMICENGIFVFESKNYSGWIFGEEDKLYWYQTLSYGRRKSQKERFYNPIMQNRTHIKCLGEILDGSIPLISVIVFSERCTLKKVTVHSDIRVINRNEICDTVSELCKKNSAISLPAEKINEIYNILYPYSQVDAATKSQHIESIHKLTDSNGNIAETSENSDVNAVGDDAVSESLTKSTDKCADQPVTPGADIAGSSAVSAANSTDICPLCGGKLIVRTAKRGANAGQPFWGCSNFPKCRYTRKM